MTRPTSRAARRRHRARRRRRQLAPGGRVVEARQQLQQRRLAGPVAPQTATISPGASSGRRPRSTSSRRRSRSGRRRSARERPAGSGAGSGSASGHDAVQPGEAAAGRAIARWARLRIQPSASSGHTSCSRSALKSTNSPIVRSPLITRWPPKRSTTAIAIDGQEDEARQVAALDRRLTQHDVADRARLIGEAPRTSGSRPNACTISIPTTPSSAASVTSADFCCAWREIGITR